MTMREGTTIRFDENAVDDDDDNVLKNEMVGGNGGSSSSKKSCAFKLTYFLYILATPSYKHPVYLI